MSVQHEVDLVRAHHDAGLLSLGAVHLARTLARLVGGVTVEAELAVAYAAQAPLQGDVAVDLMRVRDDRRHDDADAARIEALPWPAPDSWIDHVASCPLVAGDTPTIVVRGSLVYLQRYDAYEHRVVCHIRDRVGGELQAAGGEPLVAAQLLTGQGSSDQLEAVRQGLSRSLSVIIGGPGTGKTTTVAALIAEIVARSLDGPFRPRVALAAPTGKAAARLGEALRKAASGLAPEVRDTVAVAPCSTLHRLIGWSTRGTPRHHRRNPLPHDLIVIDETSMVSLPLMTRVFDAVRPDARVVLVGDPGQLASVEAGTVLSDLVAAANGPLRHCITELSVSRRFPHGSPLDRLARAVRAGDVEAGLAALAPSTAAPSQRGTITWIDQPGDQPAARDQVAAVLVPAVADIVGYARAGDGRRALDALARLRVLCAHRHGPFGVERWNQWIRDHLRVPDRLDQVWYPGRPVMVTANDPSTGLYNGDVGVVIDHGGRAMVAFDASPDTPVENDVRLMSPARLPHVDTVHAMTIHKSQGSEFDHVVVVLPPPESRLASRDLLYTALTRAVDHLTIVGDRSAIEQSIRRRTYRTGGLAERLTQADQAPSGPGEVP